MPRLDPPKKTAAGRALAPFGAVTLLAWMAVPVGSSINWPEYAVATFLVVLVGALSLTPWREVRPGSVASALLYLAAVALLRNSAGGLSSGVGVLSLVPVFYVALYGSRRTLGTVIGAVAVFYLAPILLFGPPSYPTSQFRTTLLMVVVSAIIGLTTQGLVSRMMLQKAFTSGKRILLTEHVEERVGSHEFWEAAGRPTSILDEPLLRGSEVVGILAVGWNDEVRVDGPRATVVSLLAHEAAAVIERADILGQLSSVAETDSLTGLPNRGAWDASIRYEAKNGGRDRVAIAVESSIVSPGAVGPDVGRVPVS